MSFSENSNEFVQNSNDLLEQYNEMEAEKDAKINELEKELATLRIDIPMKDRNLQTQALKHAKHQVKQTADTLVGVTERIIAIVKDANRNGRHIDISELTDIVSDIQQTAKTIRKSANEMFYPHFTLIPLGKDCIAYRKKIMLHHELAMKIGKKRSIIERILES